MPTVQHSKAEQTHIMRYQYLNGRRRLFGGTLMQWIDELAGIVAMRHCGGDVITAAVDSLEFMEPAYINDIVLMKGKATFVGKTSMEVRIDTYSEKTDGTRKLINVAYLVMVAIDDQGRPAPIPPLEIGSEEEEQEWSLAKERYERRKARRKQS